jgi:malonate decarboxylase gamma subunit
MTTNNAVVHPSRGRTWLEALADQPVIGEAGSSSVLHCDALLDGNVTRFIAVVPDPASRFPRARNGEVGLEEGWTVAKYVRDAIAADASGVPRAIVAVVDVTSQAYGRTEELMSLNLACAAAADAYGTARLAGHPIVALLVGHAISGGFLAHGYQANRILALDDPGVLVHAMGKAAAARITRRTVAELDALGETVLPMSYDIRNYAKLGLLHKLIGAVNADAPLAEDVQRVRSEVAAAIADAREGPRDLTHRTASASRAASVEVRRLMAEQWSDAHVTG